MEQRLGGGLMENNKIKHLEFIQSRVIGQNVLMG